MTSSARNSKQTKGGSRPATDTRTRLIDAAGREFNTRGFLGTDTNRIARLAGFAPQTFYRNFDDKLDVFLAVYQRWRADEAKALAAAARASPSNARSDAAAGALIRHHRHWSIFRRSLRALALDEPKVRVARAAGRQEQIATLQTLPANAGRSRAQLAAAILTVERLCDALADTETDDLGIPDRHWIGQIRHAVAAARGE